MATLLIFYLTDDRRHYTFSHFVNLLNDSKIKQQWELIILTHSDDVDFYYNELVNKEIHFKINKFKPDNNYMNKVNFAIKYAEQKSIPYMMKCDNDIFCHSQTLDFIINNLYVLDNSKHLTIGPSLSSGIPGVEYFTEQFLDPLAKLELENIYLRTPFYNRDGATYTSLNKFTIETNIWDKNEYFKGVRDINHHYMGMHPIRISNEAIHYLNDYIISHKDKFYEKQIMSIIYDDTSPYLCDSIFCIKTDIYKKVILQHPEWDFFDEVALNQYANNNNMNHLFVKHGYGLHTYYNWHDNHIQNEKTFVKDFFTS